MLRVENKQNKDVRMKFDFYKRCISVLNTFETYALLFNNDFLLHVWKHDFYAVFVFERQMIFDSRFSTPIPICRMHDTLSSCLTLFREEILFILYI